MSRKNISTSPAVNAGSMADIAFLLLIFFLVSTQLINDKSISVVLPDIRHQSSGKFNGEIVYVKINGMDELLVDKIMMLPSSLGDFIDTKIKEQYSIGKSLVVSIQNDSGTSYQAYLNVFDEIVKLRNVWKAYIANEIYQDSYETLQNAQKKIVLKKLPLIISESDPTRFFKIYSI